MFRDPCMSHMHKNNKTKRTRATATKAGYCIQGPPVSSHLTGAALCATAPQPHSSLSSSPQKQSSSHPPSSRPKLLSRAACPLHGSPRSFPEDRTPIPPGAAAPPPPPSTHLPPPSPNPATDSRRSPGEQEKDPQRGSRNWESRF